MDTPSSWDSRHVCQGLEEISVDELKPEFQGGVV